MTTLLDPRWSGQRNCARFLFQRNQSTLNRTNAGGGNIAVFGLEILRVRAHILQHRLQIFQVEQQQSVVICDLENQRQYARLGVVQTQQAAEQSDDPAFQTRPRKQRVSREV